jgi:ankyrin repeat protein
MQYIKPIKEILTEGFALLDSVRDSGKINMFGAGPVVEDLMGVSKKDAREIVTLWMCTYNDDISIKERVDLAIAKILFNACDNGIIEEINKAIQTCIENGVSLDSAESPATQKGQALRNCIIKGSTDGALALLNAGARPDIHPSILDWTVKKHNNVLIKEFIERGASPNENTIKDETCLTTAVRNSDLISIKLLISLGARYTEDNVVITELVTGGKISEEISEILLKIYEGDLARMAKFPNISQGTANQIKKEYLKRKIEKRFNKEENNLEL